VKISGSYVQSKKLRPGHRRRFLNIHDMNII
jgi:hypothetical protein